MGILRKLKTQNSKLKTTTQISNLKCCGFTLIELLVVMSVFGIVSAALVGIFLRSIKGGGKADAIAEVKENGDYALGVMERVLRNAAEIDECTADKVKYFLTEDLPDRTAERYFQVSGNQIVSETGALTSSELTLEGLSFSCSGTPIRLVSISFTLKKGETGGVRDPRTFAEVEFRGSVRLREY